MDIEQPHLHPVVNPRRKSWLPILVLGLAMLACNLTPAADTETLEQAVAATLTTVAQSASPTETEPPPAASATSAEPGPTQTAAPTSAPTNTAAPTSGGPTEESEGVPGVISGSLGYPSEQIPRLAIVFFNLDDGTWWWIGTAVNQSSYQMTVPVGNYHVVAYAEGGIAGGYTAAVPCGLSVACNDHSLLTVNVGSNARVNGIDVTDWYAPPGAFPQKPAAINYP